MCISSWSIPTSRHIMCILIVHHSVPHKLKINQSIAIHWQLTRTVLIEGFSSRTVLITYIQSISGVICMISRYYYYSTTQYVPSGVVRLIVSIGNLTGVLPWIVALLYIYSSCSVYSSCYVYSRCSVYNRCSVYSRCSV